jgi:hypothetical protein
LLPGCFYNHPVHTGLATFIAWRVLSIRHRTHAPANRLQRLTLCGKLNGLIPI